MTNYLWWGECKISERTALINLSTQKDIEDFTIGCCFFGTGGGGDPKFGQKMLLDVLNAGKKIQIVDSTSIRDDQWIVSPYLMGTSGPETEERRKAKLAHGLSKITVSNMPAAATKLLLQHNPQQLSLSAVIPYEIGGAATAGAVATAAWFDVPTIDADYVGRSVPEIIQMIPVAHGIDLWPIASSDAYGNETFIQKTINPQMVERIGKSIATGSFGLVGQATLLHQAETLKPSMLNKTLSKAFAVGKAIRKAQEEKSDLFSQLYELTGSKILLEGVISTFNDYEENGYYMGDIVVNGTGKSKDAQLKLWFKNENHIAWLNDEVHVTSPDLISILDKSILMPLSNNQLYVGLNIIVVGTPAHPAWRSEKALKLLEPRYFGFDFEAKFLSQSKINLR